MKRIMIVFLSIVMLLGCQNTSADELLSTIASRDKIYQIVKSDETMTSTMQEEVPETNELEETPANELEPKHNGDNASSVSSSPVVPPATASENTTIIPPQQTLSVTISVECSTILNNMDKLKDGYQDFIPQNGIILNNIQVEIEEGETVLEVLEKVCKSEEINIAARNGYVAGIGNIDEFACGNLSGWMYSVNDAYVNMSAAKKQLVSGDRIKWMYTCDNGRDLYFS